jgi:hypothetical protein
MKTCALVSLLLVPTFLQSIPIPTFPQVSTSSILAGVGSTNQNYANDVLKNASNEVPNGLSDLNIGEKPSQLRSV